MEAPASWEPNGWPVDVAAASWAPHEAFLERLIDALERFPFSKVLRGLAVFHPATGEVIGTAGPNCLLGIAFQNGAPAELVVRAERLLALLRNAGRPGSRRHLMMALRLAHALASMNAALAPFVKGRRAAPSVHRHGSHRAAWNRPAPSSVEGTDEPQEQSDDRDGAFGTLRPHQALAPPGRSLAAQPIQAAAPPAPRVSVAA